MKRININLLLNTFVLSCIVGVLYVVPQMMQAYPSLLDEAESFSYGKSYANFVQTVQGETIRFRPLFIAQRIFLNRLSNNSHRIYFFVYGMLLGCTVAAIYKILCRWRVSAPMRAVLIGLFLISPVTIDTFWRLGTAENLFGILLVLCVYSLLADRSGWLLLFSVLLMAAKENAIVVIPIILVYLVSKRSWVHVVVLCGVYILYCITVLTIVKLYAGPESYLSAVSLRSADMVFMLSHYAQEYALYCILLIGTLGLFGMRIIRRRIVNMSHELTPILITVAIFVSLFVFRNPNQAYYFYPVLCCIVIVFGGQMRDYSNRFQIGSVLCIIGASVLFNVIGKTYIKMQYWQQDYAGDAALIEYIRQHPRDVFAWGSLHDEYRSDIASLILDMKGNNSQEVTKLVFDVDRAPVLQSLKLYTVTPLGKRVTKYAIQSFR